MFLGFGLTAKAELLQGSVVPKLTLMTASGEKIDVNGYAKSRKKKNLLLVLFRTGNCGICVGQLTEFAEHIEEISGANAAVLALSLDDAIVQQRVSEKVNKKFPILLDPDAKTVNLFGTFNPEDKLSRPSSFLIGPDQKILYRYVGQNLHDRPTLATILEVLNHYSGKLPTKDR